MRCRLDGYSYHGGLGSELTVNKVLKLKGVMRLVPSNPTHPNIVHLLDIQGKQLAISS